MGNRRLEQKGKSKILMNRFRPNIVLSNIPKPFEEDTWKTILIGNVLFHLVKACPRCKQSCTDQMTGERFEEPLETLAEFRKADKDGIDVYFAMNAIIGDQVHFTKRKEKNHNDEDIMKMISVGDKVRVLTTGKPVWGDPAAPE